MNLEPTIPGFLDLYVSRHLYNNRKLFSNLKVKSINFVIAVRQIIYIEEIGTISIPFIDDNSIKLHNITLALGCNSNLISLGQQQETGITFYNNPMAIILMK